MGCVLTLIFVPLCFSLSFPAAQLYSGEIGGFVSGLFGSVGVGYEKYDIKNTEG